MTKEEIQKQVGSRIVQLRKDRGMKQIELAHLLEIEDSALRRIESGRTNCTIWLLFRISNAFNISLAELLNDIAELH